MRLNLVAGVRPEVEQYFRRTIGELRLDSCALRQNESSGLPSDRPEHAVLHRVPAYAIP